MYDCVLEYSSNVTEGFDNREMFNSLHLLLAQSGLFPLAAIQSRALIHRMFYIGDGNEENAFINLTLSCPPGMNQRQKQALAEQLLGCLKAEFYYSFAQLNCTITVRLRETAATEYVQTLDKTPRY